MILQDFIDILIFNFPAKYAFCLNLYYLTCLHSAPAYTCASYCTMIFTMCLRMVKQIYRSMLPGSYCTWYPKWNSFFYWQHKLALTYTIAIIILLNVLLLFSKSHNSISKGLHLIFWKSHLNVLSTLHVPTQILLFKEEEARLTHCLWAQYCPRPVYILQQKSYDIVSTIVFETQ